MTRTLFTRICQFTLACFVLALVALPARGMGPEERGLVNDIQLNAVSDAPTRALPAGDGRRSIDSIASQFRERIKDIKLRNTNEAAQSQLTPQRADIRNRSRESRNTDLEVRIRRLAKTPSQIRGMNGKLLTRADPYHSPGPERDHATARTFLNEYRHLLQLKNPEKELALVRRDVDRLGRCHLRFSQVYKNMPVWPSEVIVHLDLEGNVDVMDGAFVATPRRIIKRPVVDAELAVEHARAAIPDGDGAEVSAPELIVYAPGDRPPRLAWKMEATVSMRSRWLVLIDAMTGGTLTAFDQVNDVGAAGSGIDLFGDTRPLNVWLEGGEFSMIDTSKPMFDPLLDPTSVNTRQGTIVIRDAQNQDENAPDLRQFPITSPSSTGWPLADAVSAAFGLSETYDYYFERHGRDSLDGHGGTMVAVVRLGQNYENAFWNSTFMGFGDGLPVAGALDVVAHELTHGVVEHSAKLLYRNQPGALNEAFADIFGEAVEARTFGTPDWASGSQLGMALRSFSDPSSLEIARGRNFPAHMSDFIGPNDPFLDGFLFRDNGGVHLNSSIINHAFYLLAGGPDGGIGISDAEHIFYRALVFHLGPNSQFIDARLACIQSAEELFGQDSVQALKTAEAFDAVGIVAASPTPEPPSFPGVAGPDATLFVAFDPDLGVYMLGRREEALGDGPFGVLFPDTDVAPARPAVSGDGVLAVYVNAENDICFINTDGTSADGEPDDGCLGFPGVTSSITMSPDGNRVGIIFLDADGIPEDVINVLFLDQEEDADRTFSLIAPALDGVSTNTILQADAMDFTATNNLLVYDAFNVITYDDGSQRGVWSIYAIDLVTDTTFTLVPPLPDVDFAFPALSQTSDKFITFDAADIETGESTVLAGNLNSGDVVAVATVTAGFGVPGFTGDDTAIVFSQEDQATPTGFSLMRQQLQEDGITPVGSPELWLSDADLGVIYRFDGGGASDITWDVTGVDVVRVVCKNLTTGKKRRIDAALPSSGSCANLGLPWDPGDKVQVKIVGTVTSVADAGGVVTGIVPEVLVCMKAQTRERVRFTNPFTRWNCSDEGLALTVGERLKMKAKGDAN